MLGHPIELVLRISPPLPKLPRADTSLHGQSLTTINAVEAGVPTQGHRHAWDDLTDRAENPARRQNAAVYWIREGELSDDAILVLCDLAEERTSQGWRESWLATYFKNCEKDFQTKTLGTQWIKDFVASAVSRHDFLINLFNLRQHAIYLRLCGAVLVNTDLAEHLNLMTQATSFDAAFQRQLQYVETSWNWAIGRASTNANQVGATGRRSRREAHHYNTWKDEFDRESQFSMLNHVADLHNLPERKRPYAQFSVEEKTTFWSSQWSFGVMYNMFSWSDKFVPLHANWESPCIGTILRTAFCAYADGLWEAVGRPQLENTLINEREPSVLIRNSVHLIEEAPRAYRKYRREIAAKFSRRDPDGNDEDGYDGIQEVIMARAAEVRGLNRRRPRNDDEDDEGERERLAREVRQRVA